MMKEFAMSYVDREYFLKLERKNNAPKKVKDLPNQSKDKNQNPFIKE